MAFDVSTLCLCFSTTTQECRDFCLIALHKGFIYLVLILFLRRAVNLSKYFLIHERVLCAILQLLPLSLDAMCVNHLCLSHLCSIKYPQKQLELWPEESISMESVLQFPALDKEGCRWMSAPSLTSWAAGDCLSPHALPHSLCLTGNQLRPLEQRLNSSLTLVLVPLTYSLSQLLLSDFCPLLNPWSTKKNTCYVNQIHYVIKNILKTSSEWNYNLATVQVQMLYFHNPLTWCNYGVWKKRECPRCNIFSGLLQPWWTLKTLVASETCVWDFRLCRTVSKRTIMNHFFWYSALLKSYP